jgi:hypothetical protein
MNTTVSKGNFKMRYSSNDYRNASEGSQVKVAVLADTHQSEQSSQQLLNDVLLLSAAATVLTAALWLVH